jgi:uncharacterized protein (TIGR04255 family)
MARGLGHNRDQAGIGPLHGRRGFQIIHSIQVHYSRAPIAEAVIDLHLAFAAAPEVAALEKLAREFVGQFPQTHRMNTVAMTVSTDGAAVQESRTSQPIGLRMANAAQDRVLQLRTQGFSYSHLAPYSEWGTFVGEMRPLWERYVDVLGPDAVTRLAVRFINQIPVPQDSDLDVYLHLSPRLLPIGGERVEGYFMQLVLPQTDLGVEWKAIINTGLGARSTPELMHILLDLDVFCEKTIPASSGDVWTILEQLRSRKNELFEAAITDAVRSRIK